MKKHKFNTIAFGLNDLPPGFVLLSMLVQTAMLIR